MQTLFHDISFALRQLLKHRVYAITAILSMALGIGATAAVYSVLYGVLIDPYPYKDANRIAFINVVNKQGQDGTLSFTLAEMQQLRKAKSLEDAMIQQHVEMTETDGELPLAISAVEYSGNGFAFLGAPPMLGRTFTAEEAPEGSAPPPVAVISDLFWKRHFAGAPDVIGKSLALDNQTYTVIGVMGPRFTWGDADVYLPLPVGKNPNTQLGTLVRVRKGVSLGAATGEVDGYVRQFDHAHPGSGLVPHGDFKVKVETLNDTLLGQFKGTLFLLLGAVALLLLIGCGNVSILMLGRGTARQQELAMRAALGASRLRIVRQMLTEAVLLSVTGGVLGMAIAYLAIHMIVGLLPQYSIPHEVVIRLNMPVLLFSTAVSIATGIAAGLSPALQFSGRHLNTVLQAGDTRTTTSRGARVRSVLIAAQVALTVLLLAGAGAAMRSFLEAHNAKLGLDPHNTLWMELSLPEGAYPTWEARAQYLDALIEKIKATPGVKDATLENGGVPPLGGWVQPVRIIGTPADDSRRAVVQLTGADYFSVLHIPLLQGRTLTREEVLRGAHLAVVSEMFARRYLPNVNPIGRLIVPVELQHVFSSGLAPKNLDQPYEIVGVVGDVKNDGVHQPILPQAYVPATMLLFTGTGIFVRTVGDPHQMIHAVSMSMSSLNHNQAVSQVYVFEEFLSMFAWAYDRFIFVLFTVFSAVALGLAAIGLFSVVAYTVEQRTREIGIRMALGAQRRDVLKLALASTALTAGVGLVVGIALSVGLSDSVHRWTQGSMRDAGVLLAISAVFVVASVIACVVPARRAMRVDPMVALRSN